MQHKTGELTGALLDAAVAKAEGILWSRTYEGEVVAHHGPRGDPYGFRPSTSWSHGGPIIERERIILIPHTQHRSGDLAWWASVGAAASGWFEVNPAHGEGGLTGTAPLIAAMRAYVASKFGDTVEL